jgi:hypothetical protein
VRLIEKRRNTRFDLVAKPLECGDVRGGEPEPARSIGDGSLTDGGLYGIGQCGELLLELGERQVRRIGVPVHVL